MKLTNHLHLVPRSKMRGAIPPLSQYTFMAWCLVKNRDNFALYLYLYFYDIIPCVEFRESTVDGPNKKVITNVEYGGIDVE
jgi:hypothetical protein